MGQTVNLLSFDFGGSNPSPPTQLERDRIAEALVLVRMCKVLLGHLKQAKVVAVSQFFMRK